MTVIREKRALVTGATGGIGSALARALAAAGADLLLADRAGTPLESLALELREGGADVATIPGDLTQPEDLEQLVQASQGGARPVSLLINNAGIVYRGALRQMPAEDMEQLLALNLLAPIRLTQRLLPSLIDRGDAHVVYMCSIAGLFGAKRLGMYSASKFGLVGYSEALRTEVRGKLGVTAICPGLIDTPMLRMAAPEESKRIGALARLLAVGKPETVARVTLAAIERNRKIALVTPLARAMWWAKRALPSLVP